MRNWRSIVRPTVGSFAYVVLVAVLTGLGFGTESLGPILLAALLSLPASLLAVPGYYLAYGLLALIPGANPSTVSGWESCSPDGTCVGSETGGLAPWFATATDVLGILALACAAVLNVFGFRLLMAILDRGRVVADPRP